MKKRLIMCVMVFVLLLSTSNVFANTSSCTGSDCYSESNPERYYRQAFTKTQQLYRGIETNIELPTNVQGNYSDYVAFYIGLNSSSDVPLIEAGVSTRANGTGVNSLGKWKLFGNHGIVNDQDWDGTWNNNTELPSNTKVVRLGLYSNGIVNGKYEIVFTAKFYNSTTVSTSTQIGDAVTKTFTYEPSQMNNTPNVIAKYVNDTFESGAANQSNVGGLEVKFNEMKWYGVQLRKTDLSWTQWNTTIGTTSSTQSAWVNNSGKFYVLSASISPKYSITWNSQWNNKTVKHNWP